MVQQIGEMGGYAPLVPTAQAFNMSPNTLRRLTREGSVASIPFGTCKLVRTEDVRQHAAVECEGARQLPLPAA